MQEPRETAVHWPFKQKIAVALLLHSLRVGTAMIIEHMQLAIKRYVFFLFMDAEVSSQAWLKAVHMIWHFRLGLFLKRYPARRAELDRSWEVSAERDGSQATRSLLVRLVFQPEPDMLDCNRSSTDLGTFGRSVQMTRRSAEVSAGDGQICGGQCR